METAVHAEIARDTATLAATSTPHPTATDAAACVLNGAPDGIGGERPAPARRSVWRWRAGRLAAVRGLLSRPKPPIRDSGYGW
jgi:hypothetical protein